SGMHLVRERKEPLMESGRHLNQQQQTDDDELRLDLSARKRIGGAEQEQRQHRQVVAEARYDGASRHPLRDDPHRHRQQQQRDKDEVAAIDLQALPDHEPRQHDEQSYAGDELRKQHEVHGQHLEPSGEIRREEAGYDQRDRESVHRRSNASNSSSYSASSFGAWWSQPSSVSTRRLPTPPIAVRRFGSSRSSRIFSP